jgi:hypothetical protein
MEIVHAVSLPSKHVARVIVVTGYLSYWWLCRFDPATGWLTKTNHEPKISY